MGPTCVPHPSVGCVVGDRSRDAAAIRHGLREPHNPWLQLYWLQMAVLDEAERQQRKKNNAPPVVDAERLVRRLGVTRRAVLRAAGAIDRLASHACSDRTWVTAEAKDLAPLREIAEGTRQKT